MRGPLGKDSLTEERKKEPASRVPLGAGEPERSGQGSRETKEGDLHTQSSASLRIASQPRSPRESPMSPLCTRKMTSGRRLSR